MPIIQDPRMNAGKEKEWGLAYFEENFKIGDETLNAGHYFYRKKETGSSEDEGEFHPRFLPQGFPIVATRSSSGPSPPNNIIEDYRRIYQTVISTVILNIEADPFYVRNAETPTPTTNLDSVYPMVAYLTRCISNGKTGLPKIQHKSEYVYKRDNTRTRIGKVQ